MSTQTHIQALSDQGGPAGCPCCLAGEDQVALGSAVGRACFTKKKSSQLASVLRHYCQRGAGAEAAVTPLLPARLGLQGLRLNNTQVCQ